MVPYYICLVRAKMHEKDKNERKTIFQTLLIFLNLKERRKKVTSRDVEENVGKNKNRNLHLFIFKLCRFRSYSEIS